VSRGIDISHYNTCTNYSAAKAAVDWVYIKVTEGSSIVDPAIATHYNGFAGKPRGAYHFMHGSTSAEVAEFVSQVKARSWELPPMLDAEYSGVTGAAIRAFLAEYQRQTGEELTVVYSSKALLSGACAPSTFASPRTIIWAARYYANTPDFSTLGWDHPQLGIYQYWDKGSVPGFAGVVDLDVARVNLVAPTPPHSAPTLGEEFDMQPKTYPPVPVASDGTQVAVDVIQWDGRPAVANVIAIDDQKPVFVSKLLNWSPAGGTGGGAPAAGNALPGAGTGWRVDPNLPGAFTIPAGTTRVVFSYSCNGRTGLQIVPTA
jgi:GH25 family lysozyme M1 (1,4-beta-N-acetylmuramidase)